MKNRIKFRGDRRSCPVCGAHLNTFLPLPQSYREQQKSAGFDLPLERFETLHIDEYLCPVCGESDRSRIYAIYLRHATEGRAAWKILDIAPTHGLQTFLKQLNEVSYLSFDLNSPLADDHGDIQHLPYENESFDWVICSHVLEHVPDDKAAIRELRRVLKPDGQAILMAPIHLDLDQTREDPDMWHEERLRWRWFGQDDHLRLYSREGFRERIESSGLTVQELNTEKISPEADRFGISPSSILYLAQPKPGYTE